MTTIEYDVKGLPQFVSRQTMLDAVKAEREAIANYIAQRQFMCLERQLSSSEVVRSMKRDNESLAEQIRSGRHTGDNI